LKQDKTPLTLRPLDESHQWSVVATDLRTRRRSLYLVIADNESLRSTLKDFPDIELSLAFTDRNNVPHTCDIDRHRLTKSDIWLEIPETIERYQRRKIFRLEAPSGSELNLTIEGETYSLLLIDVSINGALGLVSHLKPALEAPPPGRLGETIENAVLIFQTKTGPRRVHIAECTIRRLEPHVATGKMQYALEFTAIDEENEQLLTKMIYEFQRDYLRRRHRNRS
jgi:hypothetical protein